MRELRMNLQNFEIKNQKIRDAFLDLKKNHPERLGPRLNLSWSNWGFGLETLEDSAARLERAGIHWIELHGNHYGPDLGYKPAQTLETLRSHGIRVAGICGMFSNDNDPASNRAIQRQGAIDYIRRELAFGQAVGAGYLLVCPSAVGRPAAYDASEFERSVEVYQSVADEFIHSGVKGAVEPIRSAEVSLCHTFADAKRFIAAIHHPGICHINGDVYHMQSEEMHIPTTLWEAGELLTNLHLADSNRCALGEGSLDLDTILMALYLIGFNQPGCFVTPEPLGPGGDPYPAMNGKPDPAQLEHLVQQSANYFYAREAELLA
jgi:D-psicose/D-tagatose/L-ribulose 3-epimerase